MDHGEQGTTESARYMNRSEQFQAEAIEIAQRVSHQWKQLEGKVKADPNILEGIPELAYIYDLTKSPQTGIQTWFEGQISFIENAAGGDEDAKSRMMHSLKEHAERIERQIGDILP